MTRLTSSTSLRLAAFTAVALALAACSAAPSAGLAPGLTARMDTPGASLDRGQSIGIVNHYRATVGAAPVASDASLDAQAQALAAAYAQSGQPPATPGGVAVMKLSAGYPNFANTFSGWRNSSADAAQLAAPNARRAGLGVAYNGSSNYGVYWVLLLAD